MSDKCQKETADQRMDRIRKRVAEMPAASAERLARIAMLWGQRQ